MSQSSKIIAILAGGKAKRFGGQDKGEIIIHDQRLIDIIYARLAPQSDEIIISGTKDYGLGLPVIPDASDAPRGPVGGLYSIWKSLQKLELEGFFTVAVDGPNLPHDLIQSLYSETSSTIAVDENGRHPTYGWWRMDALATVWSEIDLSNSISLNSLAERVNAVAVVWDGDKAFSNINRPSDLEEFVKGA